ncbi:MAG: hypothetical protein HON83_03495 [Candidatus Marinimicrobia bacterium]|jgi:hypothetical protein|nr:hypothetical protein [Candidatus Neomarinimicrobiota bacterium]
MKKLFGILAITLLISLTGIQDVTAAEWTITVNWTDEADACPTIGDYEYFVSVRIRNTCTNNEIHYDYVTLPSSTNPLTYDFDVDHVCTVDEQVCYLVSASVVKRCVISQAVISMDTKSMNASCDDIYQGITLEPFLE